MPRVPVSNRVPASVNENLITYASDISNAVWLKQSCSWLPDRIANPIDGTVNAGSLVDTAANTTHFIRQLDPPTATPAIGTMVTQSIFAKAGSRNFIVIGANNGSSLTIFDLAAGVIRTRQGAGGIQSYGNGWYRCWVTHYLTIARPIFYIANTGTSAAYAGSGDEAIYLYGAMLSHGRYPGNPTITTNVAANTGASRSRLFPVNISQYSVDFSQWTQTNCTVTSNAVADPFTGEMTASILNDNTTNGSHGVQNLFAAPYIKNSPLTQSVVAKAAPNSTAPMLEMPSLISGGSATFNLANGTIAGSTADVQSTRMTSLGNGWYRCTAVFINDINTSFLPMRINATTGHGVASYVGTGNPTIYLARSQFVPGNRSGDMINTTVHQIGSGETAPGYPEATGISVRGNPSGRIAIT